MKELKTAEMTKDSSRLKFAWKFIHFLRYHFIYLFLFYECNIRALIEGKREICRESLSDEKYIFRFVIFLGGNSNQSIWQKQHKDGKE